MITRLIFRMSVFLITLTALSISAANWVGTRIPTDIYAYSVREHPHSLMIMDNRRHWSMPVASMSDFYFTWSPNGEVLIYTARQNAWCSRRLIGGVVSCSEIPVYPGALWSFSPDGHYLAGLEQGSIMVWDMQTNETHRIATCKQCSSNVDWMPDNLHFIIGDGNRLIQIHAITGEAHVLHVSDETITRVDVSPTQPLIVFWYVAVHGYTEPVNLFDVDRGEVLHFLEVSALYGTTTKWSPDGETLLIHSASQVYVLTRDTLTEWQLEDDAMVWNWAQDNLTFYFRCANGYLCRFNTQTGESSTEMTVLQQRLELRFDNLAVLYPSPGNYPTDFLWLEEDGLRVINLQGNQVVHLAVP